MDNLEESLIAIQKLREEIPDSVNAYLNYTKNENNDVYSLDNYFTGSRSNHVPHVTYIVGNTAEIATLVTFTPDMVYHLGEYSRVEQSFGDIKKVWQYNKDGMFAVLEFVRKSGCKILYAGSSTKFGDGGLGRSDGGDVGKSEVVFLPVTERPTNDNFGRTVL